MEAWVLDVAGEQEDGKPVIWLWGKLEDGSTVVIKDYFIPYVYVVCREKCEDLSDRLTSYGYKVEEEERQLLGRKVSALKVFVGSDEIDKEAKNIGNVINNKGLIYESDIRYSNKFLLSKYISPSSWLEIESDYENSLDNVSFHRAKGSYRKLDKISMPRLKVIALDFLYVGSKGSPKPSNDPILAISAVSGEGKEIQFKGNEKDLLKEFIKFISEYDPDIVVTFEGNKKHWPYLAERFKINGLRFAIGRLGSEPRTSVYGHVSIQGRINVDFYDIASETPELTLETLEEYASYLGIKLDYDPISLYELPKVWDEDKERLFSYSMKRSKVLLKVYDSLKEFIFTLSEITGLPADHILTAATGFRVENFLMRMASEYGELIPSRSEVVHRWYAGGMVREPAKGIHERVAVIDFKSMYPSIMIKYNVSFDTISDDGENKPPGINIAFKKGEGFMPKVLKRLLEEREKVNKEMKGVDEGSPEYKVLNAKQRVLKIVANAVYGYLGWAGARWYNRDVAQAITAWGRESISKTIEKAKDIGLKVLYADTDSLFVNYDGEKVNRLLTWVKEELELECRLEKVYLRIIFTESKKKYAGITEEGDVDLIGLEAVRGDWSEVAKEAQAAVVSEVLRTNDPKAGAEKAREYVNLVASKGIPIKKLTIWKQITRSIDKYEAIQPHVVVAKQLMHEGWDIHPGDKVGYVITKGKGKLGERAKPFFKADREEVDWDYYIDKQVIPACMRVLAPLGVSEKEVRATGLTQFL